MATTAKMPERSDTLFCSFCGKKHTEVAKLIAGPGTYICDECVGLCVAILQGEGQPLAVPTLDPKVFSWTAKLSDEELITRMVRVAQSREEVDAAVGQFVRRLRERQVTWARIGEALGMTRQSAWERYSGEE